MFSTLVIKEIRNNLLNARFLVAYFATTVLIVGSAVVMLSEHLGDKGEFEANRELYNRQIRSITAFGDFSNMIRAVRAPEPLSIFAAGGERLADNKAVLHWLISPVFTADAKRSPVPALFPALDMVFVVGVVLSLLVLMMVYDAVAGEREEGVLKIMMAGPLPRDRVIAAKWVGAFTSVTAPFAVSFVLVAVLLVLTPSAGLRAQDWVRIALLAALFTLFLAVVVSVCMMISVLARRASSAALWLLLLWAVVFVFLPGISRPLTHAVLKSTRVQIFEMAAIRTGLTNLDIRNNANQEWEKNSWRELFGERRWRELSNDEIVKWLKLATPRALLIEEAGLDTMYQQSAEYFALESGHNQMAQWIDRFSPFGCLRNAGLSLASTGWRREKVIRESLITYMRSVWRHYCERALDITTPYDRDFSGHSMPLYTTPRTDLAGDIADSLPDFAALALMGVLCFMVSYRAFIRMDLT